MVIDEKQSDNQNEMEEEAAATTTTEVMATDELNTEVPSTTMVKYSVKLEPMLFFCLIRKKKQQHHQLQKNLFQKRKA